jgi:Ca-activated chloride channel homolog
MPTACDRYSSLYASIQRRAARSMWRIPLALVLIALCMPTSAQDVHIAPGGHSSLATVTSQQSLALEHNSAIRVNVDLVLVPLTVTDGSGRAVKELDKDRFELFEDKQKQVIHRLSCEDAPVSIGIVLDTSGSMKDKLPSAKEAVQRFLDVANLEDEFSIVTFADRPSGVSEFASSPGPVLEEIMFSVAKGRTALLDAIYTSLARMKQAHYGRKALFIISDGGDNHSRYTESELRSVVRESGTLIYSIGLYDHSFPTAEELAGPALLATISNETGARAYTIDDPNDLPLVAAQIGKELRTQCVLSYRPTIPKKDGKWHKIRVKLLPRKGISRLSVHAKNGYYAPSE